MMGRNTAGTWKTSGCFSLQPVRLLQIVLRFSTATKGAKGRHRRTGRDVTYSTVHQGSGEIQYVEYKTEERDQRCRSNMHKPVGAAYLVLEETFNFHQC